MCNEKGERVGERGRVEIKWGGRECVCVCGGLAGHSTAPKGESQYSGGLVAWAGWGRGEETRRRCMKAKALQTIVTLYMTSSCYNNTAVIYCTVQVRLNIWLDKADHYRHLQYPWTTSVSPWFWFFFSSFIFFFSSFPTLRHLCFCS